MSGKKKSVVDAVFIDYQCKRHLDRLQLAERFYRQQAQQAGRLRDDGFWIASGSVAPVPEDGSRVL